MSVNNLAALLERKGDYAAAEPLYRRALDGAERQLGRENLNMHICRANWERCSSRSASRRRREKVGGNSGSRNPAPIDQSPLALRCVPRGLIVRSAMDLHRFAASVARCAARLAEFRGLVRHGKAMRGARSVELEKPIPRLSTGVGREGDLGRRLVKVKRELAERK